MLRRATKAGSAGALRHLNSRERSLLPQTSSAFLASTDWTHVIPTKIKSSSMPIDTTLLSRSLRFSLESSGSVVQLSCTMESSSRFSERWDDSSRNRTDRCCYLLHCLESGNLAFRSNAPLVLHRRNRASGSLSLILWSHGFDHEGLGRCGLGRPERDGLAAQRRQTASSSDVARRNATAASFHL